MQSNQKGRAGDKDQLESPQARVCNWEVVIIADVVATGLAGVAVKVLLLIAPDLLASHEKNQKPKNKNNSEPDATKCCGVFVHSTQETLKKAPSAVFRVLYFIGFMYRITGNPYHTVIAAGFTSVWRWVMY
uniref:Uncharacterized protein n=1 Tax=Cynoglossus semilaevis TaxID=244447 RepID=A0A3P8W1J3_CYNSE